MLRYQKKKVLINMLLEEIEEEEIVIDQVSSKKVHDMFKKRKEEGFFSVLIEKHLFRDEKNSCIALAAFELRAKKNKCPNCMPSLEGVCLNCMPSLAATSACPIFTRKPYMYT
ncbi:hypothetical protein QTP88_003575 [Uroleucon formosanum]